MSIFKRKDETSLHEYIDEMATIIACRKIDDKSIA